VFPLTQKSDPGLYPYRQGLYFAFYNALNWQIATATPTVLFMAYLGADSFQTGLVYGWPLLLTPVQVFATVLLPKLGFKRLTIAGWGARSWFLLVPLGLTLFIHDGPAPWMVFAMVAAMFCYSLSRSVGAAAITTWLQGLVPESVRGRYWSTDQIMGGTASVGALVLCAGCFAWLPQAWAFSVLYAFSITGAWLALRCLKALPDIERPTVMSLATIRADAPRHVFGPGPFRPYLWLAVLYFVVSTPLVPFGAYYLTAVAGIAPASIMGYTILQYGGVIGGNWFMRSRIDRTGAKPFFRLTFILFALLAAGWLVCLRWPVGHAVVDAGALCAVGGRDGHVHGGQRQLSRENPPCVRASPAGVAARGDRLFHRWLGARGLGPRVEGRGSRAFGESAGLPVVFCIHAGRSPGAGRVGQSDGGKGRSRRSDP
jgi:MFS family permease